MSLHDLSIGTRSEAFVTCMCPTLLWHVWILVGVHFEHTLFASLTRVVVRALRVVCVATWR